MIETIDSAHSKQRGLQTASREGMQDLAWVRESQRGDTLAFNRLVLKWEKSIYNLNLRMLHDADEAAEATQEVFLAAYKSIRRFRRDAKFSTWLYRISANYCISRIRRRPTAAHYSLEGSSASPLPANQLPIRQSHEAAFLADEKSSRVRSALEFLSPEQKAVVELKFYQDLTFEEISDVVKAPLSTVKSRLYSSLEILKVRLAAVS